MKYYESEDKNHVNTIKNALQKNNGYCPCRLVKNEDTKCPCKEFRESNELGKCHCGLYIKVEQ